jgi:hypothetical protein
VAQYGAPPDDDTLTAIVGSQWDVAENGPRAPACKAARGFFFLYGGTWISVFLLPPLFYPAARCAVQNELDCRVASLLAMTRGEPPRQRILPRRDSHCAGVS